MKKVVEGLIKQLFKGIGLFHSDKIIYFESFHGNQYSDNPRAIYEWMKEHQPEYELVWGVNKGKEQPFHEVGVPFVHRFSIQWFLKMPRAKAWVINTRTPLWLAKSNQTKYVQTWHGTPLKKIGRDIPQVNIPGYTKESYDASFSEESKRWDYLVSPSTFTTKVFRSAFDYHGDILEVGYPRNDVLVKGKENQHTQDQLKATLNLQPRTKIILYAPTWRESEKREKGKYAFSTAFPFDDVVANLEEDTVLLVRMHYLVAQMFDFEQYNGKVIDVSNYYDMADLLAVSDLLMTDYSSCLFDFAITNRPMLFFMPDQEIYEKEMRGVYFSMEEHLPGPILKSQEDLLKTLDQWQQGQSIYNEEKYQDFKATFTNKEQGKAARQVVATFLDK